MGADLKQRIIDSVKYTWRTINSFASSHITSRDVTHDVTHDVPSHDDIQQEVDNVLSEMTKVNEEMQSK